MGFKENYLKKIKLGKMKDRVVGTIGPPGSGAKIDKNAMRCLLEEADFYLKKVRSLDLYIPGGADENGKIKILVLDNDLTLYNTTLADVALRKEPTLKEMISIRNAIKILNDGDVIISKKEKSIETVYNECLTRLDLSFSAEDIKKLEYDGRAAVEWKDDKAVMECLTLFEELLGYRFEPKVLRVEHHYIRGVYSMDDKGGELFGPSFIYNQADGAIKFLKESISIKDREGVQRFHEIAGGSREASIGGTGVIECLAKEVLIKHNK